MMQCLVRIPPRRYIAPACALSTGGTCIHTCNTPHSATAAPIARLIDYAPRTRRDVSVSFSLRVSALFCDFGRLAKIKSDRQDHPKCVNAGHVGAEQRFAVRTN